VEHNSSSIKNASQKKWAKKYLPEWQYQEAFTESIGVFMMKMIWFQISEFIFKSPNFQIG
jgi:hypothetical protein